MRLNPNFRPFNFCFLSRLLLVAGAGIAAGITFFLIRVKLAQALIPLFSLVVAVLENRFTIGDFAVITQGNETVFLLRLVSDHPVVVYGTVLPRMDVQATTLTSHVILQVLIYTVLFFVGILFTKCKKLFLGFGLLLAFIASTSLSIPLVLLGSIEGLLLETFQPQALKTNYLVNVQTFLLSGGMIILALVLGAWCLIAAQNGSKRSSEALSNGEAGLANR